MVGGIWTDIRKKLLLVTVGEDWEKNDSET